MNPWEYKRISTRGTICIRFMSKYFLYQNVAEASVTIKIDTNSRNNE